jgi:hypothetical protein
MKQITSLFVPVIFLTLLSEVTEQLQLLFANEVKLCKINEISSDGYEVLARMLMKIQVLCDVTLC